MKRCDLIGEHLGHSCSPEIHRAFGRYDYELKELASAELEPFLRGRDFDGLNVTMPYKEAVIPLLDRLDPAAAAIGAVNTVVNRGGVLWGYNTDFDGMRTALERLRRERAADDRPYGDARAADDRPYGDARAADDRPYDGKTVVILGTGGTSKTAMAVCRALGAAEIFRVSRTGKEGALLYSELPERCRDAALLINCTPVGMWPNPERCPLDPAALPELAGVFDCVYNPLRTRLVLLARSLGLPAAGGLEMLVRQAALACALFTGEAVSEELTRRVLRSLRRQRENLVLIGMPGAGKTTVGRLLAQKTGMEFVDLDEEIVKTAGKPIPAIFSERGEAAFRELEAAAVRRLSAGGGRVLAAGGGTVLRAENVTRLKQNGRLILLDRPLSALEPSPERPLGDTAEKLAALYKARAPFYAAAADLRVPNRGSPEEAAALILTML